MNDQLSTDPPERKAPLLRGLGSFARPNLFTIEQSRAVYWADFVFYAAAIAALLAVVVMGTGPGRWPQVATLYFAGLVGWSALEYGVHRFVLHGVQPFQRWHAEHHARPAAYVCAPTILTSSLFGALLFAPAWLIAGGLSACALTAGLLSGYLAYSTTHHAIHQWHADNAWLRRRQRWHLLHHYATRPCRFGVTSGIWDVVCATVRPAPGVAPTGSSRHTGDSSAPGSSGETRHPTRQL